MSFFDDAIAAYATPQLVQYFSKTVAYDPRETDPVEGVKAVLAETNYRVEGEEGLEASVAPFTWIIPAAEIAGVTPRRGHRITATYGGAECEFEVLPPSDDEQAARLDATGTVWTIHTKRVSDG